MKREEGGGGIDFPSQGEHTKGQRYSIHHMCTTDFDDWRKLFLLSSKGIAQFAHSRQQAAIDLL